MDEVSSNFVDGIITLQLGHYSNFIGTHWWNIQQAAINGPINKGGKSGIDHGILLREEFPSPNGVTFTPRLLCVDLKGSLHSLKEDGNFVDPVSLDKAYEKRGKIGGPIDDVGFSLDSPDQISVHHADPIQRHGTTTEFTSSQQSTTLSDNYYNLDDVVEVWSDFLGNQYNKNTVLLLEDYWYSEDNRSFSSFGQGFSSSLNLNFWESWEDKMHYFVEECDTLQGFQVLTDLADGFGGLTSRMLNHIQDCFGSKSVAVYGSWPGVPDKYIDKNTQIINSALAVGHVVQDCSFFAPLSVQKNYFGKEESQRHFPYLSYKAGSHYQTSAIIASLLDTVSLQYRLPQASFSSFCGNLTKTGHKIAASGLSLPINSNSLKKLFEETTLYEGGLLHCLTPSHTNKLATLYSNQVVLRGVPTYSQMLGEKNLQQTSQMGIMSNKSMFEDFVYEKHKAFITGTTFCQEPLKTPPHYPKYFSPMINSHGFIQNLEAKSVQVEDCPVLTGMFTSTGMFDLLHEMLVSVSRVKKTSFVLMEQTGLEQDEFDENMERLTQMAHLYDEKRAVDLL